MRPMNAPFAALVLGTLATATSAAPVEVRITNLAPTGGTYLTPVWVGFHDGGFDLFDAGAPASTALERVAEDGDTMPLSTAFAGMGQDATLGSAPFAPGAAVTRVFDLAIDGSNDYLAFASMVLPSSDFFIGSEDPLGFSIADVLDGTTNALTFMVLGAWDAGTEVDDFATSAGNPIFGFGGGQDGPDQGANENGVVTVASGADYLLFANLGANDVGPLDFDGYVGLASIEVTAVPIPAALPMLASALGIVAARRRA